MLWEIDIHPADGRSRIGPRCASRRRRASWAWPTELARRGGPRVSWCKAPRSIAAQVERLASELLADLVVETPVVGRDRRCASLSSRQRGSRQGCRRGMRHGAAEAGRDGSGGPERARGGGRFGRAARSGGDASQVLVRRRERRRRASTSASGCWRTTRSSRWSFGPLPLEQLELGRPYRFELRTRADSRAGRRRAHAAQPRGAALSAAGRDADDSAALPRAGPRPDRRRAGNDRPNVERALQPQDARRPDRLSRRARRAAVREHAQGDDLRGDAADSRATWATTIGA